MDKALYFLLTFLESGPLIFGIRALLEQPPYHGAPYFMGYDPPFTLPPLRRNEIGIDLKS